MALTTKELFFNSTPGRSVRLMVTWKTKEDLMVLFRALMLFGDYHILGCEFDFVYDNVQIYFSMAKERGEFTIRLRELEQQAQDVSQTD